MADEEVIATEELDELQDELIEQALEEELEHEQMKVEGRSIYTLRDEIAKHAHSDKDNE